MQAISHPFQRLDWTRLYVVIMVVISRFVSDKTRPAGTGQYAKINQPLYYDLVVTVKGWFDWFESDMLFIYKPSCNGQGRYVEVVKRKWSLFLFFFPSLNFKIDCDSGKCCKESQTLESIPMQSLREKETPLLPSIGILSISICKWRHSNSRACFRIFSLSWRVIEFIRDVELFSQQNSKKIYIFIFFLRGRK